MDQSDEVVENLTEVNAEVVYDRMLGLNHLFDKTFISWKICMHLYSSTCNDFVVGIIGSRHVNTRVAIINGPTQSFHKPLLMQILQGKWPKDCRQGCNKIIHAFLAQSGQSLGCTTCSICCAAMAWRTLLGIVDCWPERDVLFLRYYIIVFDEIALEKIHK